MKANLVKCIWPATSFMLYWSNCFQWQIQARDWEWSGPSPEMVSVTDKTSSLLWVTWKVEHQEYVHSLNLPYFHTFIFESKSTNLWFQEFWTSTSIAGLSNSASAATPQRKVIWLLVMVSMIGTWVNDAQKLSNKITTSPINSSSDKC